MRLAIFCFVVIAVSVCAVQAQWSGEGETDRVSVDSGGHEANGDSYASSMSADGRYVVFDSRASNLITNDTNNAWDCFIYDRKDRTTRRVSIASDGSEGNGDSRYPMISADGRYVSFMSRASNFAPNDTNGDWDVFIRDRQAGITQRVSVSSEGLEANAQCSFPHLSSDGRYVSFTSTATNLVTPNTMPGRSHVYWRDTFMGMTRLASKSNAGEEGNDDSGTDRLGPRGRNLLFGSFATNLVDGDGPRNYRLVFLYDSQLDQIECISVNENGELANADSRAAAVADDGRFVAYDSYATNLVPGDTNGMQDVFFFDRELRTVRRISVDADGNQAVGSNPVGSNEPAMTSDARFVGFNSYAENLVPGDTNGVRDVFIYDTYTGKIKRVSVSSSGQQGDKDSVGEPMALSEDARLVSFASYADTLVGGDTNSAADIFVNQFDSLPVEKAPSQYQIALGQWISGALGELTSSDNKYLIARGVYSPFSGKVKIVSIDFTTTLDNPNPVDMHIRAEVASTKPGTRIRFKVYNYATQTNETLSDTSAPVNTDQVFLFENLTADYVEKATGRVKFTVELYTTPASFGTPDLKVDEVKWIIDYD